MNKLLCNLKLLEYILVLLKVLLALLKMFVFNKNVQKIQNIRILKHCLYIMLLA